MRINLQIFSLRMVLPFLFISAETPFLKDNLGLTIQIIQLLWSGLRQTSQHCFYFGLNSMKYFLQVGYVIDRNGRESAKEVCDFVTRKRLIGDLPPCYPNGWFGVIESRSLKTCQVKPVNCLGKLSNVGCIMQKSVLRSLTLPITPVFVPLYAKSTGQFNPQSLLSVRYIPCHYVELC